MDVTDREADKANDADKSDDGETDSEESTHSKEHEAQRVNHRKRKREQPERLEQDLERSQSALKFLKKHLDRKTCPKSLQYRARARITADDEFRRDIKRLRSKAEQDYVQAITRGWDLCRPVTLYYHAELYVILGFTV